MSERELDRYINGKYETTSGFFRLRLPSFDNRGRKKHKDVVRFVSSGDINITGNGLWGGREEKEGVEETIPPQAYVASWSIKANGT